MKSTQQPVMERVSEAEWATLSNHVQGVVRELVDENRQLRLRLAKLEEQLRRNSRASSPAPSQEKADQKPVQDEGARSARRRGGPPGHGGRGRRLVAVDRVAAVVVHRPVACQRGGGLRL